jgi:hypothetical protein
LGSTSLDPQYGGESSLPQPVVDLATGAGDIAIGATLGLLSLGNFNGPDVRASLDIDGGVTNSWSYTAGEMTGAAATLGVGRAFSNSGAPAGVKTNFVVDTKGTAFPVPKNAAGPVPVSNPAGKQTGVGYTGGQGGANGQVTTMRNMNPNKSNPTGYVKYENAQGQPVNPNTGRTVSNAEGHIPKNCPKTPCSN